MTITVHLITAAGQRRTVDAKQGHSLMRAATAAGITEIAADCGGLLSCATCHVIVSAEWAARVPPPSADEVSMLEMTAAPCQPTSRLSCQITLDAALDGLTVTLPTTQY